jgi:glucose/arabinose dehydrogenase
LGRKAIYSLPTIRPAIFIAYGHNVKALVFTSLFLVACAPARSDWLPHVPSGFHVEQIATIPGARELAFAPDGALFIGTNGGDIYIVPHAESSAGAEHVFASPGDAPAAGVSYAGGSLYVGTQHAVWRLPYRSGELHALSGPQKVASVRGGQPPARSDGDVHSSTSVAASSDHIYASVGSSCNACVETDPTRATVGEVQSGRYKVIAKRIRNAIALAINPATQALWVADAGQDELAAPHPYEFFDDVSARRTPVDYGWPFCFEDRKRKPGSTENCNGTAVPRVIFPAYETPIGAVFYPPSQRGRYAFPKRYSGGAFVTLHGSWHGPAQGLSGYMPPRVVFVPMRSDMPQRGIDWNDPSKQWIEFADGYQDGGSINRTGRPTGIAIGPLGDLFIGDDQTGAIYRIRP